MLKKLALVVSAILGIVPAFFANEGGSADSLKTELAARDEAVKAVSDDSVLYFSDAVSDVVDYHLGHWSHSSHQSHRSHSSHYSHRSGRGY